MLTVMACTLQFFLILYYVALYVALCLHYIVYTEVHWLLAKKPSVIILKQSLRTYLPTQGDSSSEISYMVSPKLQGNCIFCDFSVHPWDQIDKAKFSNGVTQIFLRKGKPTAIFLMLPMYCSNLLNGE